MSGKIRILCLHGFTSNGAVHAHQLRRLTSLLPEYDFLFPDGPHSVDMTKQVDADKPANVSWSELVHGMDPVAGHRAWWFARDGNWQSKESGGFYGLEESLSFISRYLQDRGPVHAIWGFSQGACYAGMLCALFQDKMAQHPLRQSLSERFVATPVASGVIFSGFRARFAQYDGLYEPGVDIPMLHVLGEQDPLVNSERSEEFIRVCNRSELLKHDGGHNIPKQTEDLQRIAEFIRQNTGTTNNGHSIQASM